MSIRIASVQDAQTLADIHVPSKKKTYVGIVDADYLNAKTIEEYTEKWTRWMRDNPITVAISYEGDRPAGFICWGPLQTPPPGTSNIRPQYPAEIYSIHVHPDFWRSGHGTKLMRYAAGEIQKDQKNALCLWVLKGNKNADAFYRKLGGQKLGKKKMFSGPTECLEFCYGWRDLSVLLNAA